jgi:hypothetical protein
MRSTLRRVTGRVLAACLSLAALTACGGSKGPGGITQTGCLAFSAAGTPTPGTVTCRAGSGSGCDLQRIEVRVAEVADLFAASFTVVFDPAVVSYVGHSLDGSVLASGGERVEVLSRTEGDRVILGLSRVAPAPSVDVSGTAILIVLSFARVGTSPAAGPLVFQNAALLGDETPPVVKPGIAWFGGVFRVP